jgi:hypothetical protein
VNKLIQRWLSVLAVLMVATPMLAPGAASAQGDSRTFPETGKTVRATFLKYWTDHGGLAQQGYPISEEMQETSATDGKTYTVQYFERAVFELHPEFAGTTNEVLLSLLGVFLYKQKYTAIDGAPGQTPNNEAGSVAFPETGKRVGGKFLAYWQTHGGLAQQGLPISDEFTEVSDLDNKPYRVQYFERAVFEIHPEFAGTTNEVLLSQLGTFRYRQLYLAPPTPTVGLPTATPVAAVPTPTTAPPAPTTPPAPPDPCADIPPSVNQTVTPRCGERGTTFAFSGGGFQPGELVGVYATRPDGSVNGAPFQVEADSAGVVDGVTLGTGSSSQLGIWANTFEGTSSGHHSIGYFKVIDRAAAQPTPTTPSAQGCDTSGNRNGSATPSSGRPGTVIAFRATGFRPDEAVSYWFTLPNGVVVGTSEPVPPGLVNPDGSIGPLPIQITSSMVALAEGRWAITFQGASSGHTAVIYFCVLR